MNETKTTKKLVTAGKHSSINKVFFERHTHGLIGRDVPLAAEIQMSCLIVSMVNTVQGRVRTHPYLVVHARIFIRS